jgi:hypothetical protein
VLALLLLTLSSAAVSGCGGDTPNQPSDESGRGGGVVHDHADATMMTTI